MSTTKNIKIENTRKLLDVGSKSIEIEDQEKHLFITDAKNKEEIVKKLKPSLIVEAGETALKPLIYTLPDGVTIKGLSKKTKDSKIIGIIKVEQMNKDTYIAFSNDEQHCIKPPKKVKQDLRWLK